MERKCATVITVFLSFIFSMPLMGKSMQLEEPFYKAYIKTEGLKYRVVVNGVDIKNDKSRHPLTVEIPVNQFVKTGENKLELQIFPLTKEGDLYISDSASMDMEFRLYTGLEEYVILSELHYSAKNAEAEKPFDGSSTEGRYALVDNTLSEDASGEYSVSPLAIEVQENKYNKTYMRQNVTMPTPFPEWKFLTSDPIPDPAQFKTREQMIGGLVGKPYAILETIHTALSKKDIDSIMPLFKERNDEMDKAFYYKPGTYEKLLRDAFQEEFSKDMILMDMDIDYAKPMVSPGNNIIQLGSSPMIEFKNKEESVFSSYDIFFRKDGDQWIITR